MGMKQHIQNLKTRKKKKNTNIQELKTVKTKLLKPTNLYWTELGTFKTKVKISAAAGCHAGCFTLIQCLALLRGCAGLT